MTERGRTHPEDRAFRAKMDEASPGEWNAEWWDRTVLAVYADWLDDRGDPRGAGYRLLYESGHSPWAAARGSGQRPARWAWWRLSPAWPGPQPSDPPPELFYALRQPSDLPPELFYALRRYSRYDAATARASYRATVAKYYGSRAGAFAALARVAARAAKKKR